VKNYLSNRINRCALKVSTAMQIAICSVLLTSVANSSEICDETEPASPLVWFQDIPSVVDAAAVLNSPADRFLLKESGKSIRTAFAMTGFFTQTEHAWDALAKTFNANTDDTIRSLLGQRVVIVWDEMGSPSGSFFQFAKAIDNQWTLICEVDPEYLDQIQSHLKPVRRRIELGQPVYAIEKGRYEIVLLDEGIANQGSARVLIAPKKGAKLLDHVLESFVRAQSERVQDKVGLKVSKRHQESILSHREQLINDPIWQSVEDDWLIAWIVQLDQFVESDDFSLQVEHCEDFEHSSVFAGVTRFSESGFDTVFASDIPMSFPDGAAPVGLLNAVGDDAILAIASVKLPNLFLDKDQLSIDYPSRNDSQSDLFEKTNRKTSLPDGPGFILLAEESGLDAMKASHSNAKLDDRALALTVLAMVEEQDSESNAKQCDQIMRDLYWTFDPENAPSFEGRFPNAIRTHQFESSKQKSSFVKTESKPSSSSWPGNAAKLSWVSSELDKTPTLIATLAPNEFDTAKQTKWVSQISESLNALPIDSENPQLNTFVLTRGYFHPSRAVSILDTTSPIDLVLSKLVDRVSWDLTRTSFGLRGVCSIELGDMSKLSTLGINTPRK